jgi:L-fucose isomerase-like protein
MSALQNMPRVKMGIVGVSRNCFPKELSQRRLRQLVVECRKRKLKVYESRTVVETEQDAMTAVAELSAEKVNALVIYLGNFGPEGPAAILARTMGVPFMLAGAAEENRASLVEGRGDALCGMLSVCMNLGLRSQRGYLAPNPIALPAAVAADVEHFFDVARVVLGVRNLKVIAFGPRPQDFFTCHAPLKPLYDLGVEVMENSELDLLELYRAAAEQKRKIQSVARDMARELKEGNDHPEKLAQLAQFEVALTGFFEENLGSRQFGVYANKCWPAFEKAFGFPPCYVNSRLAARGIPAACEVDIYGAVSEYMVQLAAQEPATLLDINNSVPGDIEIADLRGMQRSDLFMGFHCGNTPSCYLCQGAAMKYQLIMHRLMEPGQEPNISCGTLEGTLKPGPLTVFRLQSTPDGAGTAGYAAQGEVLDADPCSFGAIGVMGIPEFARFYRHVLLERKFAHHTAVGFQHVGRALFDAVKLLGVEDIRTPLPAGRLYPSENPFGG